MQETSTNQGMPNKSHPAQAMNTGRQAAPETHGHSGQGSVEEEIARQKKKEDSKRYNNMRKRRISILKQVHKFHKSTGHHSYWVSQDPVTKKYTAYVSPGGSKWPPRHRKIKRRKCPVMTEHTTEEFDALPESRWGLRTQKRPPAKHWMREKALRKRGGAGAVQPTQQPAFPKAGDEPAPSVSAQTTQFPPPMTTNTVVGLGKETSQPAPQYVTQQFAPFPLADAIDSQEAIARGSRVGPRNDLDDSAEVTEACDASEETEPEDSMEETNVDFGETDDDDEGHASDGSLCSSLDLYNDSTSSSKNQQPHVFKHDAGPYQAAPRTTSPTPYWTARSSDKKKPRADEQGASTYRRCRISRVQQGRVRKASRK